jgi:hypothetical protein
MKQVRHGPRMLVEPNTVAWPTRRRQAYRERIPWSIVSHFPAFTENQPAC